MDSSDRAENAKPAGAAMAKKKYKNIVVDIYRNIIDSVLEPLREEFIAAGCDVQTMQMLRELWYEKIKASKAVNCLLQPEPGRSGALSAAERAEAVARRDVEVANERKACSSTEPVNGGQPSTSRVITIDGTIESVLVNNVPALPAADASQVSDSILVNNSELRPEWSFPKEALQAAPTSMVWLTLKLPVRISSGAVQLRKLHVRVMAEFLQQQSLYALLNAELLSILASMPMNAASGVLQRHLNTLMVCDKPTAKRLRQSQQLDGGGDEDDDSDDCFYNYNQPVTLSRLLQQQHDYTSSSDGEVAEAFEHTQTGTRPKRLNRSSKSQLKSLFNLCSSSTSSSNESDKDTGQRAKQKQLFGSSAYAEQENEDIAAAVADADESDKAGGDEVIKALKQDSKEVPLNTDDDLSSLESNEDTDNICICLFDKVQHAKNKWRMNLRSGIMNIHGEDYIFNAANVSSTW